MADWREAQAQRDQAQREHPEYEQAIAPGYRNCHGCNKGILEDAPAFVGVHDEHWYCPACASGTPAPVSAPAAQPRNCWECGHPLDGATKCPRCGEQN